MTDTHRFSRTFVLAVLYVAGCADDPALGDRHSTGGASAGAVGLAAGGTSAGVGGSNAGVGGAGVGGASAGVSGSNAGVGGASAGVGGASAGFGGASIGGAGGASAAGSSGVSGSAPGGTSSVGGASSGGTAGGAGLGGAAGSGGTSGASTAEEWLPSWATTIQRTEPNNMPPALNGKTLRQFVWPTVSGDEIRIQLSNEKGEAPVAIEKVHIARANTTTNPANSGGSIVPSTDSTFTFNGAQSVTIPAGQTVWSDALSYPLVEIELTAISAYFGQQVPSAITGHPGARTTSYISSGDGVSEAALAGAETRDRWYFINAIEVMAPADAYAVAVLGDSITDGYGVLNQFARWPDFMTLEIKKDPVIASNRSVLNFGMGANSLVSSSTYQDAGVVRFERDVLTRDKIKWLVVLEGVNDINGGVQAQPIIDAYREIIRKSHEKGILVYGSPITPNGAGGVRATVNEWVRTSGEFDAVIDLDAIIRDPGNPNDIASMFDNDGLHPNLTGYQAMGEGVDLMLFYEP
jgi:lysophospholipase L1-like esterase